MNLISSCKNLLLQERVEETAQQLMLDITSKEYKLLPLDNCSANGDNFTSSIPPRKPMGIYTVQQ